MRNLDAHRILDTCPEPAFDDLARLASEICGTPYALVSLVDADRLFFKSSIGLGLVEAPREGSFCDETILHSGVFIVPDAAADPHWFANPLVIAEPYIRFFAGVPLVTQDGFAIGAFSVLDRVPRELQPRQLDALQVLGRQVARELILRRMSTAEESYTNLFNKTAEGVLQIGLDGKLLSANPAMARILGYDSQSDLLECLNTRGFPLCPEPADRSALIKAMLRNERIAGYECRLYRKDRSIAWVRGSGRAVREPGGEVLYLEGVVSDITDQRLAEIALSESEQRFRELARTAPVGIFLADPEGTRIYVNERWREITGTKLEAPVQEGWIAALHPDDRESVVAAWDEAVRAGEQYTSEHRFLRPDGSCVWVYAKSVPVRDSTGAIARHVGTVTDITELKSAQLERDRFFELSLDFLCITGFDGFFKKLNPIWSEKLGYSMEELMSTPFLDFVHPDDRAATAEEILRIALGAETLHFENRYRCADGTYRWLQWAAQPFIEGSLIYASARDITEIKRFDGELQQKNMELENRNRAIEDAGRMKNEFLANMSHELRTPLNGIIGFAELLHDETAGPMRDDQKEFLNDILQSGRQLLQLINDLLDISRLEASRIEFQPEAVEIEAIAREACEILEVAAAEKKITVSVHIDPHLREIVIDPARLKQVIYNYLTNALKFTAPGGRVAVSASEEDAGWFRLQVADSGIGIRPDDIPHLFAGFRQLDEGASKRYQGAGLGLALNKKLVEAQGGRVGVSSTPGVGSTFFALLPRVPLKVEE